MDNTSFCLLTSKNKSIKDLFELLHDLINEGNLECSPNGIRMLNKSEDKSILVYLKLFNTSFEKYQCDTTKILGFNTEEMFKIIKLVENNETLTLYVSKDDENRLCVQRYNKEENIINTKSLTLYDIRIDDREIKEFDFDNVVVMPSHRFHKICREFSGFDDKVEIISNNNTLYFKSNGERVRQELIISETEDGITYEKCGDKSAIYRGLFNLKYLVKFSKCANLCTNIILHLKNDYPLIIECEMKDFGLIRLCISEIIDD